MCQSELDNSFNLLLTRQYGFFKKILDFVQKKPNQ